MRRWKLRTHLGFRIMGSPLTTPVGGGIRSLNVIVAASDPTCSVCLRPVRHFNGIETPTGTRKR